jgi:3-hydroxybutyryl-CoA dehydrogenase
MTTDIRRVGVVGCGTMGMGIVQAAAEAGLEVVAVKATPGALDGVRAKLDKAFARAIEKGKLGEAGKHAALERVTFTADEGALRGCDLVIESIVEDAETKRALFRRLETVVGGEALLASNTSTLSITALMAACEKRGRVAGLHFFNPVSNMKLVEVVRAFETTDATVAALEAFARRVGKDPVVVEDTTGFIVNRLLTPYLLSALRLLEQGTGTIAEIDKAMKLGCGHPMGPFELADYIGLDVLHAMSTHIYDDAREPHLAAPHTLIRLVQLGYLGRKTGKGFYDYSHKPPVANAALRRPVA